MLTQAQTIFGWNYIMNRKGMGTLAAHGHTAARFRLVGKRPVESPRTLDSYHFEFGVEVEDIVGVTAYYNGLVSASSQDHGGIDDIRNAALST